MPYMCNLWFSLCSHYPLLSFQAIPWRNHIPCKCLNVVRSNLFKPGAGCAFCVACEQFEVWLSPQDCVTGASIQNCAGARGTCGKQSGFLAVEGSGSAGVAEGDSDKWCIISSDKTCRVSCREPHWQQFILSSLKFFKYPFIVDPPTVWRALLGSCLVRVSFFKSRIMIKTRIIWVRKHFTRIAEKLELLKIVWPGLVISAQQR